MRVGCAVPEKAWDAPNIARGMRRSRGSQSCAIMITIRMQNAPLSTAAAAEGHLHPNLSHILPTGMTVSIMATEDAARNIPDSKGDMCQYP